MAYLKSGFYADRGQQFSNVSEDNVAIHRYKSDDTLATIAAGGYFPANFGFRDEDIQLNDLLEIDASDDVATYRVTGKDPLVITPEPTADNPFDQSLNTTDSVSFISVVAGEFGTIGGGAASWDGAFSAPVAGGNYVIKRNGSVRLLEFPGIESTADTGSFIDLTATLSVTDRPSVDLEIPVRIRDNGTYGIGVASILVASGAVSIRPGASPGVTFAGAGTTGFGGFTVTYVTE